MLDAEASRAARSVNASNCICWRRPLALALALALVPPKHASTPARRAVAVLPAGLAGCWEKRLPVCWSAGLLVDGDSTGRRRLHCMPAPPSRPGGDDDRLALPSPR